MGLSGRSPLGVWLLVPFFFFFFFSGTGRLHDQLSIEPFTSGMNFRLPLLPVTIPDLQFRRTIPILVGVSLSNVLCSTDDSFFHSKRRQTLRTQAGGLCRQGTVVSFHSGIGIRTVIPFTQILSHRIRTRAFQASGPGRRFQGHAPAPRQFSPQGYPRFGEEGGRPAGAREQDLRRLLGQFNHLWTPSTPCRYQGTHLSLRHLR